MISTTRVKVVPIRSSYRNYEKDSRRVEVEGSQSFVMEKDLDLDGGRKGSRTLGRQGNRNRSNDSSSFLTINIRLVCSNDVEDFLGKFIIYRNL